MAGTAAGKLFRFLFFLALVAASAIPSVTARPISSHSWPCGMTSNHPTAQYPATTTVTAATADPAAALRDKYGSLLFISLPRGAFVPPSAPRNNGHRLNNR